MYCIHLEVGPSVTAHLSSSSSLIAFLSCFSLWLLSLLFIYFFYLNFVLFLTVCPAFATWHQVFSPPLSIPVPQDSFVIEIKFIFILYYTYIWLFILSPTYFFIPTVSRIIRIFNGMWAEKRIILRAIIRYFFSFYKRNVVLFAYIYRLISVELVELVSFTDT